MNAKFHIVSDLLELDLDFSLERELESVGNKIQNYLFPHVAIHIGGLPGCMAIHHQPNPRPICGRAKYAGELGCEGGKVSRLVSKAMTLPRKTREPCWFHSVLTRSISQQERLLAMCPNPPASCYSGAVCLVWLASGGVEATADSSKGISWFHAAGNC
jgi:hypothetical protein